MPKDPMKKFDFLIGTWDLEFRVPKSAFSEAARGRGSGVFKRALDGRYVFFDYTCQTPDSSGEAHAVFARDMKAKVYRYWWFESSGNFETATCAFVDEGTLCLNWHDTLLTQTFRKEGPDRVVLKMDHPDARGKPKTILKVIFTRK